MSRITSREYKLILVSTRFQDRKAGSNAFRDLVGSLTEKLGGKIKGQDKEEARETSYLDTKDFQLRKAGYAFRKRYEADDDKFKLTLKFRSPDLMLADDASVKAANGLRPKPKFEQDLMPPFRSVFSRSSSVCFNKPPKLKTLKDAIEIFPALKSLDLSKKTELTTVNGFKATEVFRKLCKVDFKKAKPIKLGLSFWYAGKARAWPLIAECAFDFDRVSKKKGFDLDQVRQANDLFELLQKQPGWFNTDATTKTRYAYEGLR